MTTSTFKQVQSLSFWCLCVAKAPETHVDEVSGYIWIDYPPIHEQACLDKGVCQCKELPSRC